MKQGEQEVQGNGVPILVVDDEQPIRRMLTRLLERNGYLPTEAGDVDTARSCMQSQDFALVLCDITMPGGSGIDLLSHVREDNPDTAILMVTGIDDPSLAQSALRMGAYGYILKPFEANEILINVVGALRRRELEIENREHRDRLEELVRHRTSELWDAISSLEQAGKELRSSREETVHRLSMAAELRDPETTGHLERMSRYCSVLAREAGEDSERSEVIRLASKMHDVGKIGIPDAVLLKPGTFNPEERAVMQRHAQIGYEILRDSESDLVRVAATIALTHHERIDGTGYPNGLSIEGIPLEGRIAAVADVFDALTSDRVYRKMFPLGKALEIMEEGRGTHFDPEILEIFNESLDSILDIMHEYRASNVAAVGASA